MKQRTKISRYVNNNTSVYSELLKSEFPIEYQFLVQEYLLKLMPFYVFSKRIEIPNDIVINILKILYRPYFLWHNECDLRSHKLGIEYLIQKQIEQYPIKKPTRIMWTERPTSRNNFSLELKGDIWELLGCECCILQRTCKYNKCNTLITTTSNYCKKHMRCAKCHFNIRLTKCNCGENSTYMSFTNLGIETFGVDNHLQTPAISYTNYGYNDNNLMMPTLNVPKKYYLQTKEDRTVFSNEQTEQIQKLEKLILENRDFSDDDIIDGNNLEWGLEPWNS